MIIISTNSHEATTRHSKKTTRCHIYKKDNLCPRMERPVKNMVKEILRNLLSEAKGGE